MLRHLAHMLSGRGMRRLLWAVPLLLPTIVIRHPYAPFLLFQWVVTSAHMIHLMKSHAPSEGRLCRVCVAGSCFGTNDHAELGGGNSHGGSAKRVVAIKAKVFEHLSLSNWEIAISIALPARTLLGGRSAIYPAHFVGSRQRSSEQAGLADILDGEHADDLSVLGDRQRSKATLLEEAKTVLEKVSLGRDCGDIRLHQVTDARIPLWG